jgi:hypothetical protein
VTVSFTNTLDLSDEKVVISGGAEHPEIKIRDSKVANSEIIVFAENRLNL